jgi:hypothetical protein
MTDDMIKLQSESALKQWGPQWRKHARINSVYDMKSLEDFEFSGVGKAVLCVANGYSLEENIETIKKYQHLVDIIVCDKAMGHLFEHGITPKFVMVCDANVSYEKYMKPWEDKLQDTILLSNVCGSLDWPRNGNWKDKYFFTNQDVLGSEKEFIEISGCKNVIAAGTNVSNAMVVILTQCTNEGPKNFFGYDKILLIGYDYSWRHNGKYYAFDEDGGKKAQYMRHNYCQTSDGDFCYSSGNLLFSAQWFENYVRVFNLPVVQCTTKSVLSLKTGVLAEQMQYNFRKEDAPLMGSFANELREINKRRAEITKKIKDIKADHWFAFMSSV